MVDKAKRNTLPLDTQLFSIKPSDFKQIWLPKDEYAHVMSEIATNLNEHDKNSTIINKRIGNYLYTAINNDEFGDYTIIGKVKIE